MSIIQFQISFITFIINQNYKHEIINNQSIKELLYDNISTPINVCLLIHTDRTYSIPTPYSHYITTPLKDKHKIVKKLIDQVPIMLLKHRQILQQCLLKILPFKQQLKSMITFQLHSKQQVLQPFEYVTKIGGKKIRLCMAILLSEMFTTKLDENVIRIGGLIQYLHTASLIIDDIEDGSILRRQKPCSHLVYGLDRSINAANLVYFLPFRQLLSSFKQQHKKQKILQIFVQQMVSCHLGQAEDVLVHKLQKSNDLPTLQQYYRLISAKTSSLLRMMVGMIGVVVGIDERNLQIFIKVMNFVGISFQITDDILNLSKGMGKGVIAEDLHQKKFTIIVHFLRNNEQFMQQFIHPKKSQQSIKRMLGMIQKQNIVPKCKQIAQSFSQMALQEVDKIECNSIGKQRFKKLIEFIIKRDR